MTRRSSRTDAESTPSSDPATLQRDYDLTRPAVGQVPTLGAEFSGTASEIAALVEAISGWLNSHPFALNATGGGDAGSAATGVSVLPDSPASARLPEPTLSWSEFQQKHRRELLPRWRELAEGASIQFDDAGIASFILRAASTHDGAVAFCTLLDDLWSKSYSTRPMFEFYDGYFEIIGTGKIEWSKVETGFRDFGIEYRLQRAFKSESIKIVEDQPFHVRNLDGGYILKDILSEVERYGRSLNLSNAELEIFTSVATKGIPRVLGEAEDAARQLTADATSKEVGTAIMSPTVPAEAPELYEFRADHRENPEEFILRVYGDPQTVGLTQAHLKPLDPKLYAAYRSWKLKHSPNVELPTQRRATELMAEALGASLTLPDTPGARRVARAMTRRPKPI